jgi:hypothetical protein
MSRQLGPDVRARAGVMSIQDEDREPAQVEAEFRTAMDCQSELQAVDDCRASSSDAEAAAAFARAPHLMGGGHSSRERRASDQ